ncbi:MAG: B12-binding domain-containing radical SAM protein [Planctomycetes bacterium]|nr:B12-binding domain-containing radical SAM protein [Planctomycetota bacterium]
MKLTIIQPCMGRRIGEPYIRTWQMEPLAPAVLAALTPRDVETRFYDDRVESIPYDEPTDLVAITVETYTAKRAYQIASEYRRRGVPSVMGGFHATLASEEVSQYADSVVVGEAEEIWGQVLEDFQARRLQPLYRAPRRPPLGGLKTDRSIFRGKRYLPLALVEAGRGCPYQCEFCAIQSYYSSTQTRRPIEEIVEEIRGLDKKAVFIVDDNIVSDIEEAKKLFKALIPLKIQWMSQASVKAAQDEECLRLMRASGCQGLLIGFETLNPRNLKLMRKSFNASQGGYDAALATLQKHGLRVYGTFIFGYDHDDEDALDQALGLSLRHDMFLAAFNHLLPFPGTPLYRRLKAEGRLLYDPWWLHPEYRFGMTPLIPKHRTPEQVHELCRQGRAAFYGLRSILRRSLDFRANARGLFGWARFVAINLTMRRESVQRIGYPLGDEIYRGRLLKVGEAVQRVG